MGACSEAWHSLAVDGLVRLEGSGNDVRSAWWQMICCAISADLAPRCQGPRGAWLRALQHAIFARLCPEPNLEMRSCCWQQPLTGLVLAPLCCDAPLQGLQKSFGGAQNMKILLGKLRKRCREVCGLAYVCAFWRAQLECCGDASGGDFITK